LGTVAANGAQVAIKIIEKNNLLPKDRAMMDKEKDVLRKLDHPNIIKMLSAHEDEHNIYFVLEYKPGRDMFSFLQTYGRLKEQTARKYFKNMLDGVEYLHKKMSIVHRDLKLENLLLDESYMNVTITDFGLCDYIDDAPMRLFCGSPCYAAPELIQRIPYDGVKVDIWSLGILLYVMLFGMFPWYSQSVPELFQYIQSKPLQFPSQIEISRHAKDLIVKMLEKDPSRRIAIDTIKKHPWMRGSTFQNLKREFVQRSRSFTSLPVPCGSF